MEALDFCILILCVTAECASLIFYFERICKEILIQLMKCDLVSFDVGGLDEYFGLVVSRLVSYICQIVD